MLVILALALQGVLVKHLIFLFSALLLITSCASTNSKVDKNDNVVAFVELSFDLTKEGKPTNIMVINSEPKEKFDSAAIRALSKWEYKPKMVDGKAVIQKGLTVKLDFTESK